ncbi:MFS transporter [Candidatus Nitrospira salsa]
MSKISSHPLAIHSRPPLTGLPTHSHASTKTRSLLFQRDFSLIWWSQCIAQVGDGVTKLALLWFVYAMTGSPIKTTVIGILQTLPPILFGPLIGVLVDRLPKKPILVGMDLFRAVTIGLIPCLVTTEAFTVESLYILVFCNAMATSIFGPALYASIPLVVPRSELTAANSLLQSTMSLGIIFGPLLSGLGIAASSSQDVLCINAITYVASAVCLMFVRLPKKSALSQETENSPVSTIQDLMEGIRFTFFTQPMILLLIITAGLYSFGISAFNTLLPVFGREMLGLGPVEVGYLTSALGVGLLISSISLVWITTWRLWRRINILVLTSIMTALAIWGLLWADNFLFALVLLCLIGAGSGALTPIEWGIVQEVSPPHLLGRVLALYGTGAMLAAIAGMTTLGWISEQFGEEYSLAGTGFTLLMTAFVAKLFSRWAQRQTTNYSETN